MIPQAVAALWLGAGAKYRFSRWISKRSAWELPFSAALRKHGISLNAVSDLAGAIEPFRGKVWWEPDPVWGAGDYVSSPITTLNRKGGDCDDLAWLNASAVESALGPSGWRGLIVNYLATPWVNSHHFCAAVDPSGFIYVVQPQPAKWQPHDLQQIWCDPYQTFEVAAKAVASTYPVRGQEEGTKVVAMDVRDTRWAIVRSWARC